MYGVPTMKLSKKVSKMFCSSKVIFCFQSIKVVARLLIFTGALFQFSLLKWLAASLILLDGKSVFHLNRGSHLHQWKRAQKIHWTNHKSNPGSQCEARENVCFFFRLVEKVLRDLLAIQQKWWWKTKANGTRVTTALYAMTSMTMLLAVANLFISRVRIFDLWMKVAFRLYLTGTCTFCFP